MNHYYFSYDNVFITSLSCIHSVL